MKKLSWIFALVFLGCSDGENKSLAQGKALLAEKKFEAAAAELKKAAEKDKNSLEAWMALGDASRGAKKLDDALSAYVVAKRIDRHSIAPHLAHARVQLDLGRIELAITELNFVVEMDPKNLEALLTLGRISQQPHKQPDGSIGVSRLDLERAELNLDAASRLAPQNAEVQAELAKLREKLGRKPGA